MTFQFSRISMPLDLETSITEVSTEDSSVIMQDTADLEPLAHSHDMSKTQALLAEERRINRESSLKTRVAQGDQLKEEGNGLFEEGCYAEAIVKYGEAAKVAGLRPVIMSNLAAAYLKLEQYALAEWACDCALLHLPNMAKARFRRALARKRQGLNKAAELDLLVLTKHHPDIQEAREELAKVRLERKRSGDGQRTEPSYDEKFPPINSAEWDPPLDSDSEDSKHTGNIKPCKFYNHGRCDKGLSCEFSHAPDDSSVRDNLGHNVCANFLLDRCKQKSRCSYSHDKSYLGEGWWSSTIEVKAAIKLSDALADPTSDTHTIATLKNTSLYGRLKKARDYRSKLHSPSTLVLQPSKPSKLSKPDERSVLIICLSDERLFDNVNGHLLKTLKTKVKLIRATYAAQALSCLQVPELAGVIVADSGITERRNSTLAHKLVEYVEEGGSIVFGCLFPSLISSSDFNCFFPQYFGLDWEYGSYFRTTFFKNPSNDLVKENPFLDGSYSMKALHAQEISGSCALYIANQSSLTQSLVFPPSPITNFDESPAVTARVGSGRVSFLGDVNAEESSTNTILAMLGLLDQPPASTSSTSRKQIPKLATTTSPSSIPRPRSPMESLSFDESSTNPFPPSSPSSVVSLVPTTSHDTNVTGSTRNRRFIMQLTLDFGDVVDKVCKPQLDALRVKIDVKKVTSDAQAIELLASPNLCGIFATDPGLIYPKHSQLLQKLVDYVAAGGCLVFGGTFASFVQRTDVPRLFAQFNLPWKVAAYTRDDLELNPDNNATAKSNMFLPKSICIKALWLSDVCGEDMLYIPKSISGNGVTTPIAFGGDFGNIGFIGDVNGENCTTPSLLAMFDLLKPSGETAKPQSKKFVVVLAGAGMLDEYEETSLLSELNEKDVEINTKESLSEPRLVDLLSSCHILGVLILGDVFYSQEQKWLGQQVAVYAWSGGTVIFAGEYGTMTPPHDFKKQMIENFCLPWELSSATELSVKLNEENAFIKRLSAFTLQKRVFSEGAFIYGTSPEAIIYGSQPGLGPENAAHVSVAYSEVGNGHVAFFGHEEITEFDTSLMLAMMKL